MSTYNNDTEYELMELLGLKDLRNAQLILATIASINRITKTAAITVTETCPELAGQDLTEVPFFYHCEYSTGTLADLEKGYRAFIESDLVYCLFVPENQGQEKQFYIVGHADIRQTRLCLDKEYLLVKLTIGTDLFVTLFDTEEGAKIDLSEFENLVGSPAKPASFPCFQSAMIDWYNYNFVAPTTSHYVEGVLEFTGSVLSYINYPAVDGSGGQVNYTGTSGGLIDFDTGNEFSSGYYTVSEEDDIYNALPDDVIYDYHSENTKSGIGKYPMGGGQYHAWWKNIAGSASTEVTHTNHNKAGFVISENVTYDIWSSYSYEWHSTTTITLTGDNTSIETADYTYHEDFNKVVRMNFAPIGRTSYEAQVSWSGTIGGTIPKTILANDTYRNCPITSESYVPNTPGEYPLESLDLYYWSLSMRDLGTCCKVGQYYVYSLIGGLKVEYIGLADPSTSFVHEVRDMPFSVYVDNMYLQRFINPTVRKRITCIADCGVADIYGSLKYNETFPNRLNLIECLTKTSAAKSTGLNSAITELFQYVISYYNYTTEPEIDDLIDSLSSGPSATVGKKKNI